MPITSRWRIDGKMLAQLQRYALINIMKYSGDIGEEIVSNFFDNNFSEILSFRDPKTKDNA
ncbi:hypothetical protein KA005_33590, partial [bacterium]|nr:hypothetical protein [bacterium]